MFEGKYWYEGTLISCLVVTEDNDGKALIILKASDVGTDRFEIVLRAEDGSYNSFDPEQSVEITLEPLTPIDPPNPIPQETTLDKYRRTTRSILRFVGLWEVADLLDYLDGGV